MIQQTPSDGPANTLDHRAKFGYIAGLLAFAMWGVFPLYFKWITAHASAAEVLVHRIIWSTPVLIVLLIWQGKVNGARKVVGDRRSLGTLFLSALLIAANWLLFIHAIGSGQTLQASLGYFLNPLLNVALGVAMLDERLNRIQWTSLALAATGAIYLAINGDGVPWIALSLACSFAMYGFLRKTVAADAPVGLFIETTILAPFVLSFGIWQAMSSPIGFGSSLVISLGLVLGGPLTVAPLVLFTVAARILPLSTVGFMQYLAPTLQFLIAVVVFHETFDHIKGTAFVLIWIALALYAWDTIQRRK
jgi:chloramphenicol-sensitive protein RarD